MNKVISLQTAARLGGRRVFTNGVFDILHVGHVRTLQAARALGDCLIVGLNGDVSARALKGERHPVVPQAERAEILAALACVDYVVIFDEVTAERVVETLKPEIYVKGGDYVNGNAGQPAPAGGERAGNEREPLGGPGRKVPPEAKIVERYGGQIVFIPYAPGRSTTNLIAEILKRYCP